MFSPSNVKFNKLIKLEGLLFLFVLKSSSLRCEIGLNTQSLTKKIIH